MGRISRRSFGGLSLGAAAWAASMRSLRAQEQVLRTHGGSLLGALKYPEGFAHFDYVNPDAPKGGDARIATSGSFDSFNPFIVKGDPPTGIGLIFDTLMESALDEGSTHYCALAEWEEHPADDSWVAFRLRDEARWHDGRPITVDDVIWTFRTLIDKGVPNYRFYYQNVVEARDMGDRVVRFDFDQAGNRELPHIMGQLVVLPKHWWEDGRDFAAGGLEPMLGSGPYRIGDFEVGRFIEYERVEDYWGRDVNVHVGQHNFDTVRYEIFLDEGAALDAFRGGLIDYRSENSASNWAERYDFAAARDGRVIKEEVALEGPKRVQYFAMNLRRPKFQNLLTRRALALAFDFEWTNRTIYFGQYARPSSYFQGVQDLHPWRRPKGLSWRCWSRSAVRSPKKSLAFPTPRPRPTATGATAAICATRRGCWRRRAGNRARTGSWSTRRASPSPSSSCPLRRRRSG
jgi:microcin C transport system substrate-binding protein